MFADGPRGDLVLEEFQGVVLERPAESRQGCVHEEGPLRCRGSAVRAEVGNSIRGRITQEKRKDPEWIPVAVDRPFINPLPPKL